MSGSDKGYSPRLHGGVLGGVDTDIGLTKTVRHRLLASTRLVSANIHTQSHPMVRLKKPPPTTDNCVFTHDLTDCAKPFVGVSARHSDAVFSLQVLRAKL